MREHGVGRSVYRWRGLRKAGRVRNTKQFGVGTGHDADRVCCDGTAGRLCSSSRTRGGQPAPTPYQVRPTHRHPATQRQARWNSAPALTIVDVVGPATILLTCKLPRRLVCLLRWSVMEVHRGMAQRASSRAAQASDQALVRPSM